MSYVEQQVKNKRVSNTYATVTAQPDPLRERVGSWMAFQNNSRFFSHGGVLKLIQHMLLKLHHDPYVKHLAVWQTLRQTIANVLHDDLNMRKTPLQVMTVGGHMILSKELIFRLLAIQHHMQLMSDITAQPELTSRPEVLGQVLWLLIGVFHILTSSTKVNTMTPYQEDMLTYVVRKVVTKLMAEYLEDTKGTAAVDTYNRVRNMKARIFLPQQRVAPKYQGDPFHNRSKSSEEVEIVATHKHASDDYVVKRSRNEREPAGRYNVSPRRGIQRHQRRVPEIRSPSPEINEDQLWHEIEDGYDNSQPEYEKTDSTPENDVDQNGIASEIPLQQQEPETV